LTAARLPSSLTASGRPAGWLGLLLGLLSVAAIVGAMLFGYFYLSDSVDAWPPADAGDPALGLAAITGATAVLAGLAGALLERSVRREQRGSAFFLGVLLLASVGFVAVDLVEVTGLPFDIDSHAYGAIFITLHGTVIAVVGAGALVVAAGWKRLAAAPDPARRAGVLQVVALYWMFTAATVLTVWAVLYLWPRLL
jgi:heme/copper-type cytochrome/quinol oxidase subunit 3